MTEKKPPAAGRERGDAMDRTTPWLDWAVELQAMAQAGLYYGTDPYGRER